MAYDPRFAIAIRFVAGRGRSGSFPAQLRLDDWATSAAWKSITGLREQIFALRGGGATTNEMPVDATNLSHWLRRGRCFWNGALITDPAVCAGRRVAGCAGNVYGGGGREPGVEGVGIRRDWGRRYFRQWGRCWIPDGWLSGSTSTGTHRRRTGRTLWNSRRNSWAKSKRKVAPV